MSDKDLSSKKWERLRAAVLARDHYLDQVKKRFGKSVGADTVHHIFPREYWPEYTFEAWNLISVSHSTHNALHDRETHKLTAKGWDLLVRTARKQNIEVDQNLKNVIAAAGNERTRPLSRSNF